MSDDEYRQRKADSFAAWYYGKTPEERIDRVVKRRNARVQAVTSAWGTICYICRQDVTTEGHIDHVIPRFLGGTDNLDNLRLTHARCNLVKGKNLWLGPCWYGYNGVV